jgi:chemotaxis protein CheD
MSHSSITVVLHPGDVACADRGDTLETLLGSCVAVILTDRSRTVGTMCHIVHYQDNLQSEPSTLSVHGAIDRMYAMLIDRAFNPSLCDAFVYGGGNMFPHLVGRTHVGNRNVSAVLNRLSIDRINVVSENCGGTTYRRLRWTVGSDLPSVVATEIA